MTSSRRKFMALSGLASAGLLLPRHVWGAPTGIRQPAPATPLVDPKTAAVIGASTLTADEPMAKLALDAALKAGASYADVRLVLWMRERVSVRDDHISGTDSSEEYGLGIRVIANGAWGFAATPRLDQKSVTRVAQQAVKTAKRNAMLMPEPVELAPTPAVQGVWVSPYEVDPFAVPLKDKASYLIEAAQTCLKV
ncbi:MAG: PmbA/TldA family metallopeptidase, partial [Nannocystaceae bacterium]